MQSITIELPDPLKSFVEEKVAQGAYASPSDFVQDLVARAFKEDIEKKRAAGLPVFSTKEELEQLLLEGIEDEERGELVS